MVAAPDVVVCFLAALAQNMLLIATSTVVVVMMVVFIYICGNIIYTVQVTIYTTNLK